MRVEFTVDMSGPGPLDAANREGRLDRGMLTDLAGAVEAAGIDRLLLADRTGTQDVAALASYVLHATATLGLDVEHHAGTMEPEIAARQIATLDQLNGGRINVHIVPPAGENLTHEESFARLDEFLVLLKRLWANDRPIDHEGRFHRLRAAFSGAKPFGGCSVPIVLAGVSGTAVKVAARHADRFVLPAVTIEEARQTIARVRAAASCHGRAHAIRFALPVRPAVPRSPGFPANEPAAHAEATVLSGSPEKIALTLLDYCEIGITDFVIAGLNTPREIAAFGEGVVAPVRRTLAHGDGSNVDQHRTRPVNVVRGRWRRYSD